MKTFFLALILGIFVGSIMTNYFANPQAYENLKEAKAKLFAPIGAEKPETPLETSSEPESARFDVGSGELDSENAKEEPPAPTPLPAPKIEAPQVEETPAPPAEEVPTPEASPEAETATPIAPLEEKAPEPKPENEEVQTSQTDQLIEEGTQKAEEIVEAVAEKAKEVAKEAQPMIETGIDLTIAAGIRAQYQLERRIDSDAITISVKDNIVTLSGTVPSEETKRLAIEIAVFTKGVNGVEETLSIAE